MEEGGEGYKQGFGGQKRRENCYHSIIIKNIKS